MNRTRTQNILATNMLVSNRKKYKTLTFNSRHKRREFVPVFKEFPLEVSERYFLYCLNCIKEYRKCLVI